VRLLLDTQVALWWLIGAKRLSAVSRRRIAASACVVSVASIWEVAIKHRLGKLPVSPERLRDGMGRGGATILSMHDEHAIGSAGLATDHADPFDRILMATALAEGLQLLTADAALIAIGLSNRALPILSV
jgi:PIN domain nuclease of toxin-antitoxin system